jgi:uncharacterized protein (DUF488 family)
MPSLYTIGHSTHTTERLLELLSMHMVSAVADVRSAPYSRYNPQFNRDPLRAALRRAEIEYVFLGRELGARSPIADCSIDGRVQFDLVAKTELFRTGRERLRAGMDTYRIALLCAEKDPIACHRMILVCRAMRAPDVSIAHILEDGELEDNRDAERRIMREHGIEGNDLFATEEELIEKAYDLQGKRIAYTEKGDE